MSVFMSDFITTKTSWRNWRLFNKELCQLLARFWLRIFMLNSKNMPHFDLTFGNGEQDKILFQGLSLSKSKGVEQDPYTEKNERRHFWLLIRKRYCVQQKMALQYVADDLLIFMLILIKWLQKVNSIFRAGAAASSFASNTLCCWTGWTEVKHMLVNFIIPILLKWRYESLLGLYHLL